MNIVIDKNYEPPNPRESAKAVLYPWGDMVHGDSFLVKLRMRPSVISSFRYWQKQRFRERGKLQCITRLTGRDAVRVWLYDPDVI